MEFPFIDNHVSVPDNYRGKEIFECMNAKCKFRWRGNAGMQSSCWKCGSIHMKWENFHADWVLINNEWKRKNDEYS